jgi:hypothetical protein
VEKIWEEKTTVPAEADIAEALSAIRKNRASLWVRAEETA